MKRAHCEAWAYSRGAWRLTFKRSTCQHLQTLNEACAICPACALRARLQPRSAYTPKTFTR